MGAAIVDYAKSAFDLIEEFERLTTADDVVQRLAQALAGYGYTSFLITGVPEPPHRVEPWMLANFWPVEFSQWYTKSNYYPDDPVAAFCRQTIDPYEWAQARYDPVAQPRAEEIMRAAADHGMRQGYCVPVARGNGTHACVTMAGERPDLDPNAKRAIHIISLFAHARVVRTLRREGERPILQRSLTAREKETLQWASHGKSAWETSVILGVSERTVNGFLASAQRKLGATNRTQAVVNAIRSRQISL